MTREEAIRIISGEVLGTTEQTHEAVAMAVEALSAQPDQSITEWQKNFKGYVNQLCIPRDDYNGIMEYIDEVPSAQSEAVISKQEYAEFFLGWLEEYRKKSAELQGRYLPFEVLGWAASDFRKCFPERSVEP